MNNANGQFKSRSEAGFPIKGSRTSPLNCNTLKFFKKLLFHVTIRAWIYINMFVYVEYHGDEF